MIFPRIAAGTAAGSALTGESKPQCGSSEENIAVLRGNAAAFPGSASNRRLSAPGEERLLVMGDAEDLAAAGDAAELVDDRGGRGVQVAAEQRELDDRGA